MWLQWPDSTHKVLLSPFWLDGPSHSSDHHLNHRSWKSTSVLNIKTWFESIKAPQHLLTCYLGQDAVLAQVTCSYHPSTSTRHIWLPYRGSTERSSRRARLLLAQLRHALPQIIRCRRAGCSKCSQRSSQSVHQRRPSWRCQACYKRPVQRCDCVRLQRLLQDEIHAVPGCRVEHQSSSERLLQLWPRST